MLQLERFPVKNFPTHYKKFVQMQATQNACPAWCHRRSRATTWGIQRKGESKRIQRDRGDSENKARRQHTYVRDRNWRPEGGEWKPIKISSKFEPSAYIPKNHPSPQAFWPKFRIAMKQLNQHKKPRTSERNHEANRKNCRTDLPRPV